MCIKSSFIQGGFGVVAARWKVAAIRRKRRFFKKMIAIMHGSVTDMILLGNDENTVSSIENTIFCARKRCFLRLKTLFSRLYTDFCCQLFAATSHLTATTLKFLCTKGFSCVGGRVAAISAKKIILCRPRLRHQISAIKKQGQTPCCSCFYGVRM